MYGKPKELTIEEILKRTSEWDLWQYYIPGVILKRKFKSPLRKDETPSVALFVSHSGALLLKDFATGITMNIWSFLQARYGLNFREALVTVNNDFNLKLMAKPRMARPTMEIFGVVTQEKVSYTEGCSIRIKKRDWNVTDQIYWAQYGLTTEFLDTRMVKPLQNYWINEDLVYWYSEKNPAYSYEFGYAKRKIYSPYSKKFKFLTNAGDSILQGIDYLPQEADTLIITKAYKDVLVLQNLGYNSVAPQSESMRIPEKFMQNLKVRFDRIYLLYDNDATGMKFSKKLCDEHGLIPIFVPEPTKDISDFRKNFGIVETVGLLKTLINENRQREEVSESDTF
jgi:hypothetical protein